MSDLQHVHLTTVAMEKSLCFKKPISQELLIEKIETLFQEIKNFLLKEGCPFIGHLKALLDAGDHGQIFFSVTRFDQHPRQKGMLEGDVTKGSLIINVIVPHVPKETLEKFTSNAFQQQFGGNTPA